MKKKNNIEENESLFDIKPFFSSASPTYKPIENNKPSSITKGQASEQPTVRLKSSELPGISIKNILNNKENNENNITQEKLHPITEKNNNFSQNDLTHYWKEFIRSIPEKKILASTMQSCIPVLKENFFIEVMVDNPIQEKEVLNERIEILSFLSEKLQNGKIQIYIKVAEQGENKKNISPRDRFKAMLEHNPSLELLRSELGLEID